MEDAIRKFLAEEHIRIVRETSIGELNCRCPLPLHEDKKSSFSVNKDTGLWHCYGCDRSGNFVQLYASVKEVAIWNAIGAIRERFEIDMSVQPLALDFPEYEKRFQGFPSGDEKLRIRMEYFETVSAHPYYLGRGFSESEWFLWEGGFDQIQNCVVFPVKSSGDGVLGLVGRSISDSDKRFMNYVGSHPAHTLYGMHLCRNRKIVVVCEGLFDTQRIYRVLGDKVDVVGLLTAGFSAIQLVLLSYWDEIDVWLDNDEEGFKATCSLCESLLNIGKIVKTVPYYADVKDQADKGILDKTLVAGWNNRISYVPFLLDNT